MSEPLISIIVTCYNQGHCIDRTLESVKTQTYDSWECIIIDDGSTDNSSEVIKRIISDDPRFHYCAQKNQGVAKARNVGFASSRGEYINFLDGDDTFLPQKLERQLEVFKKNPDIFVCICDHQHFWVTENKYDYYRFEQITSFPLKQLLYGWHNNVAFPSHSVIYKKQLWLDKEEPFDLNYKERAEDWVFNIGVALKNKEYFFLDEVLCNYHHSRSNFTANELNNEKAFLNAAIYIYNTFEIPDKRDFINHALERSLLRYSESRKVEFLKSSGSWRLGFALTHRIYKALRFLKLRK